MPLEQYTFDPSWIDSDFITPQEQHTFNPSRINADFAIPVGNFTDANIQARSEADHDDNRLSKPRFESNDFQYTIRDNPSPTDLSWTPYGDQATTQDLEKKNQQHSIIGLSQIGQTHTTLSRDFGSTKSPSVTQALAAAKAEEATWQEVLCIRRRTEDLKRIAQTGRTIQGPTAQGDGVYF
jgi:hypothetical protein